MTRVSITRSVEVPDRIRLARYLRAPELGPRVLFFSGGTALRATSRLLPECTHNSVHLITPFDSGGSSAKIRDAFPVLAVGDLRNRMMALADNQLKGHPEVYRLFAMRLPQAGDPKNLTRTLDDIIDGEHPLIEEVPAPLRRLIRTQLEHFRRQMPRDFDLAGASIGNLILIGGLLANDNDIDAVLFMFAKLVEVRGVVRPVVNANLHLAGMTSGGRTLIGQHLLTSPEVLASEHLEDVWVCESLKDSARVSVPVDPRTRKLISKAELIVYPIGSFFTSVMACLQPVGLGAAVASSTCPKVYVANCGLDPEQGPTSVERCVELLLTTLRKDAGPNVPTHCLLNLVIVDSEHGDYPGGLDVETIRGLGVEVLDVAMCAPETAMITPRNLRDVLLSIV